MPWADVKLVPGVNTLRTPTLIEAGYASSKLTRFRDGLMEKLGGFQKFYPFSLPGVPRDLHAWQDLNLANHLGTATTTQLAVITGASLQDITPQTLLSNFTIGVGGGQGNFSTVINTSTVTVVDPNINNVTTFDAVYFNTPIYIAGSGVWLAGLYAITQIVGANSYQIQAAMNATATVNNSGATPIFTTVSGTSLVGVQFNAHGFTQGQQPTPQVVFPLSTSGNGVTIMGAYSLINVVDANDFQVVAQNQASASSSFSMNGGQAQLLYYINLGPPAAGSGWGLGGWGSGGWGTGVVPSSQTGTPIPAADWTTDNWGEIFVACPNGGGIYQFDPTGGFTNAGLIPNAPIFNAGMFVTMPSRQIMAYGSTVAPGIGLLRDPMEVRWCDVDNFTSWTASSTNQAGAIRLSPGSTLIAGTQGPQNALLWSDLDTFAGTYLGAPLVWGFNKIAGGAGIIGPRARCQLGGAVFWMSQANFYAMGGSGPEVMPCTVWDAVFQNIDRANQQKSWAWANTPASEVWFFWPSQSGGTGECDSHAKFNIREKTWDVCVGASGGALSRSCGIDQSVLGMPISASRQAVVYQHEVALDADGAPLVWAFNTGFFMIGTGEDFFFVDVVIPDFRFGLNNGSTQNANILMSFNLAPDPAGPITTYGPFTVNAQTPEITDLRMRGRLMSFTIGGADVGTFARLARVRYRYGWDGRFGF